MKLNLRTQSLGITLVILLLLPGCLSFSGYGRITPLEEGTTIQDLATDWKAFHVTYCGVRPERPLGVMFDPKDDPYSLTGKSWRSIRDSGGLERTLMWLEATDRHPPAPRLWRIVGPEGQFFGYLYTGNEPVVMRSIDEHTLYVMELTEPHIKNMRENAGPF